VVPGAKIDAKKGHTIQFLLYHKKYRNNAQRKLCKKYTFYSGCAQALIFYQHKAGKHTHLPNASFSVFFVLIRLPRVLQM
jgi:hypothetical protein